MTSAQTEVGSLTCANPTADNANTPDISGHVATKLYRVLVIRYERTP